MISINDLLALQHVPRWSIVPHVRPQSVAEHTFGVLAIALELSNRMEIQLSSLGLIYGLMHDGPESRSGDIPATAKRLIERKMGTGIDSLFGDDLDTIFNELSDDEKAVMLIADRIEGYVYINKWGIGVHAHKVALLCREEVTKMAESHSDYMGRMVESLLVEMATEHGR